MRHQRHRTAGQDLVENQPRRSVAEDAVIGTLSDEKRRIRSGGREGGQLPGKQIKVGAAVELKVLKLRPADEQVHVAFDEAG
jgi:hypothetical protein